MNLFDDVRSQFIDEYGKTRVLNYSNISLVTSPLPPLDVRNVPRSEMIFTEVEEAIIFCKNHALTIVEQDGDPEAELIRGIWIKSLAVSPPIVFGYIPVSIPNDGKSNAIDDIPFSDQEVTDFLFPEARSKLSKLAKTKRIACYLKEYSLIEWAHDPEGFGTNIFKVIENHVYGDIDSGRLIRGDRNFYFGSKIIVPDKDTAERLISYVNTLSSRIQGLRSKYLDIQYIEGSQMFTSVKDFSRKEKQLIFMTRRSLIEWKENLKKNLSRNKVYSYPQPQKTEPYYFRNLKIKGGSLCIVQNTIEGDLHSALKVSDIWDRLSVNSGYDTISTREKTYPNFEVYTDTGIAYRSSDEKTSLAVFGYNDGSYGALLAI